MYCHNCGTQAGDKIKFCHNCGVGISTDSNVEQTKEVNTNQNKQQNIVGKPKGMTREEYMARTNIKSVEEAQGYLSRLKFLFIAVFVGMIIVKGGAESINEDVYMLIWLVDIILLIYFVVYCVKVIKAEKIAKTSAALSIIFAPISWIWFYPAITEPLKIIIGEKEPPYSLPPELSPEEKEARKKAGDKAFWHKMKILLGVSFGAIFIICLILYLAFK